MNPLIFRRSENSFEFYRFDPHTPLQKIPMYLHTVQAGFPSPAEDYIEVAIDLNKFLVDRPSSTFYVRVKGLSMINAGIMDNALLVIDRSEKPKDGKIVLAVVNGEFTVKTIQKINGETYLMPANEAFKPIKVEPEMQFIVWGVVKYIINEA
ncbi:LexA family transcriptional regulator [Emticicia sp. BO119]|uniref:LexA family protein n=1 Tax=Emticicia sp. BO119 TaxID=2757768 RepID=UPI0015F02675|nr:translesion error-prone DNA polymerase V autoproteolytic subunit [Emticicia sp. BO119]MBA4852097.1 translesion error-prone DNA polymerase V autoproteolytic subunit [Emticicia sp. BO119]